MDYFLVSFLKYFIHEIDEKMRAFCFYHLGGPYLGIHFFAVQDYFVVGDLYFRCPPFLLFRCSLFSGAHFFYFLGDPYFQAPIFLFFTVFIIQVCDHFHYL